MSARPALRARRHDQMNTPARSSLLCFSAALLVEACQPQLHSCSHKGRDALAGATRRLQRLCSSTVTLGNSVSRSTSSTTPCARYAALRCSHSCCFRRFRTVTSSSCKELWPMWPAASSFCTVTVSAACAVTTSALSRCNTTAAAASTRGPPPTQPLRVQRGLHCGQRAVALAARLSQSSRQVSQPPPDPATPGSLPGTPARPRTARPPHQQGGLH